MLEYNRFKNNSVVLINYKLLLVAIIAFLALMSSNQICMADIESDHKACIKQCLKNHGCSDDNGKQRDKSECVKYTFKCPKECLIKD
ncbi:hypothetical protein DDB_G0278689 [Dictyostelium discoideum AX4]|uniref:Uncharacterized protein n=1 Tax=Dictyostelium discoideum TaxID=44689 RepID=Q54Y19_DICDI|nr:hypothetical protein DDB_G0278689 [Dictyostelium discoideum AX4]EAL68517.1 hypothetical protein DDB_G0278689 [Dictyostelium discoideum AX4]|eukprot:XP_642383.1 hypothetical protein DDB_G0278689 [Dictyostelium discoideum AX4]